MNEYNPHDIEPRWQKVWAEEKLYEVTEDTSKPKRYVLEMFPYPSGDIHMGHVEQLYLWRCGCALLAYARLRSASPHGLGRVWFTSGKCSDQAS